MAKQEEEAPWSQEVLTGQSEFDNATVLHSFNVFAGKLMICVSMCVSMCVSHPAGPHKHV